MKRHQAKPEGLTSCSGCTDRHSEGTHQMHTKQHPCPKGGDPDCGYCFPPEVSPEKKERCVPCAEGWDFHTHTPPAKEEKECMNGHKMTGVGFDDSCPECEAQWKKEKECDWCKNVAHTPCPPSHKILPTPTEQKGEWEEEFDEFLDEKDKTGGATIPELKSFIAAKKKEWEAQKEQAVKAEIKEMIKKLDYRIPASQKHSANYIDGREEMRKEILSLLSDKVNH